VSNAGYSRGGRAEQEDEILKMEDTPDRRGAHPGVASELEDGVEQVDHRDVEENGRSRRRNDARVVSRVDGIGTFVREATRAKRPAPLERERRCEDEQGEEDRIAAVDEIRIAGKQRREEECRDDRRESVPVADQKARGGTARDRDQQGL